MCFGLLATLTILTYANSLHGKFVFDDLSIILQNSALTIGENLHAVAGWELLTTFLFVAAAAVTAVAVRGYASDRGAEVSGGR